MINFPTLSPLREDKKAKLSINSLPPLQQLQKQKLPCIKRSDIIPPQLRYRSKGNEEKPDNTLMFNQTVMISQNGNHLSKITQDFSPKVKIYHKK